MKQGSGRIMGLWMSVLGLALVTGIQQGRIETQQEQIDGWNKGTWRSDGSVGQQEDSRGSEEESGLNGNRTGRDRSTGRDEQGPDQPDDGHRGGVPDMPRQQGRDLRGRAVHMQAVQGGEQDLIHEADAGARNFSLVLMETTAYCPCSKCCGEFADGYTSTGARAVGLQIAADPRIFPYGTTMVVPGYGTARVSDTGGAFKGQTRRIDLLFPTHQQALNWGRRTVTVKIYTKGKS